MDYQQRAIPMISLKIANVSFEQIVTLEQAHKYENVLSDVLKGDWDAFDAMFTVEPYDVRKPLHDKLPGSEIAAKSERYVFCADMPFDIFDGFMGAIIKN